ncbi:MAG: arginine--tRNA ligase [Bacillota bacterium]
MTDFKDEIAGLIAEHTGNLNKEQIYGMLEYPPEPGMGDLALPCFKLAREMKKAPPAIAAEIRAKIPASPYVRKVEAVSGYLNFHLEPARVAGSVISAVFAEQERYGSRDLGRGKRIVIDFSAPNIAKPFHVGHLRSTVIGHSLYRIFEFLGYKCIGINHLGDWGTQFGKMIVAYRKWGSRDEVEKGLVSELMRLYVKFHDQAEGDPSLEDEAREWFRKMESGDEEALDLWRWFKEISLKEFSRIYGLLGIQFDSMTGESFYNDRMGEVVDELRAKSLLIESEGAWIVDLGPYGMPPCLILKKDGGTLYATRDIAAALYRKRTYDFARCIYVVASAQNLHFQQWIKVVELMGYSWAKDLVHVPFGLVSLEGEKLATRKGNVVLLQELLEETIKMTREIIEDKNPALENKEEVARDVGVGAVIFSDLSNNRIKDVVFSWKEALNFDGETGPYVQYTHARACSIIRKAGKEPACGINPELLIDAPAFKVIKTIYRFPEIILQAVKELEPSIISRYLIDLAQDFNGFYHECQVLVEDTGLMQARLALAYAVKTVLAAGLRLLGLKAPERM